MENSKCILGFLHDYQIVKNLPKGVLERCAKCKDEQWFPNNIPNHIYLSFHKRLLLRIDNPRFKKEYK